MSPIGDWVATTKMLENIDNVYTYKFSRNILLFPNNLGQRGKIPHQVSQLLNKESVHSSCFKKPVDPAFYNYCCCKEGSARAVTMQGILSQIETNSNLTRDRTQVTQSMSQNLTPEPPAQSAVNVSCSFISQL